MNLFKKAAGKVLGFVLRRLPAGAPSFIYRNLLLSPPLRRLTKHTLTWLLPQSISIPEGVLYLNPEDPVISGALALGVYEPFETELFRKMLKPGMVVLDIGANLGYHTVIAAQRVGPGGAVLSFEPEPKNYSFLIKNIEQNGFGNVRPYTIAVSDRRGRATLNLSDSNKGKHSLVTTKEDSAEYSDSMLVQTDTVDAVLAKANLPHVNLIKMDIEGAEPLALRGMDKTLESKDLALLIEFWPAAIQKTGNDPEAFLRTLESRGFAIFEIRETGRTISPVTDYSRFTRPFHGDKNTNLLCTKNPLPAL